MEIEKVKISSLALNTGQIEGVPANPRVIKDSGYKKLIRSIEDDPEFMELKPIYIFKGVVVGGNMRLRACKELGWKQIPAIRIPEDTAPEKLRAFIVKDNSHYGENDWEAFANEWSDSPLSDWGAMQFDYEFQPNYEPGQSAGSISPDDVDKAREQLAGQFSGAGSAYEFEIICPKCGHEFKVSKNI